MPKVRRIYPMNTYYTYTHSKYTCSGYANYESCENRYTQSISTYGEDTYGKQPYYEIACGYRYTYGKPTITPRWGYCEHTWVGRCACHKAH
jgi:hypothetical protein